MLKLDLSYATVKILRLIGNPSTYNNRKDINYTPISSSK